MPVCFLFFRQADLLSLTRYHILSAKLIIPRYHPLNMNFPELVQKRESCRKYAAQAVEREKIEQILEACRLAPSACNSQPWRFVIADDPRLCRQLAETTTGAMLRFNHFCLDAPVMVALVAEPPSFLSKIGSSIKDKDFYLMDIGIVAEHFCLQAAELGLGSCMIGWFDEKKAKELLDVPAKKRIPLLISLGYPAKDKIRKKIRMNMDELRSYNKY